MKSIRTEDIQELNDIIVELPAFRELKSKDMISNVLDIFMKEIYQNQPKELIDAFNFKLSEKMQNTFFRNYGIDKDYDAKLMGYVKSDIAYQLERLFQNKGSNTIFKMLATIMESIFPRINFYNVEVHKQQKANDEGYLFDYRLKPIYIQHEETILERPELDIEPSRKYLMKLINFEEYTVWPVPTNLVYIQFNVGTDLINNLNTFLHGVRSYSTTYLSGLYFNYLSESGAIEKLEASDMELIVAFFQMNLMKLMNPDWDGSLSDPSAVGSQLSIFQSGSFVQEESESDEEYQVRLNRQKDEKCGGMQQMALFFREYQRADYSKRKDMNSLRRRWQFFLSAQATTDACYDSIGELNDLVEKRYPRLSEDFWESANLSAAGDDEEIINFYVKIYSIFLNGANSSFIQSENKECFTDYAEERAIVSYTWRNVKGDIISNVPQTYFTPTDDGADTITLTVENEDGFVNSDTVTIVSTDDGFESPSVAIDRDRIVQINTNFQIKGRAEAMVGETIEGYEWIMDGDVIKSYMNDYPAFTPIASKNLTVNLKLKYIKDYHLELKVWDSTGQTNYNQVTIRSIKEAAPKELYPQANAGPNLRAKVGDKLAVQGSGKDIENIDIHDTDWIMTYIDVVFGSLFLNERFMVSFFYPIMDLFEKYFFPVEVEYLADLANREKIKDKWNSISTEEVINPQVIARNTSLQTPIRGLDQAFSFIRVGKRHSYIDERDFIRYFDYDGIFVDYDGLLIKPPLLEKG